MIPLRRVLEAERKKLQVPWNVLEQDYYNAPHKLDNHISCAVDSS